MVCINIARLVILKLSLYSSEGGRPISMQYRLMVPCFSMVMDCIIVFNEEIIIRYTVQEEDTQYFTHVHCSHYYAYGLQYNK